MLDHSSRRVFTLGPLRQYQPSGRRPVRRLSDSTALRMCGALLVLAQEPVLDPAPAVRADIVAGLDDARAASGIALQSKRAPKTVSGSLRSSNTRITRQNPTRLPNS